VGLQVLGERPDGFGVAPFGDEQDLALLGVSGQRDVVMTPGARSLIDGQRPDGAVVGLLKGQLDVAPSYGQNSVGRFAGKSRHGVKRHLLSQHQQQRFVEQSEPQEPTGELRFDQPNRAIGQQRTLGVRTRRWR
jgi:hypothetical protein